MSFLQTVTFTAIAQLFCFKLLTGFIASPSDPLITSPSGALIAPSAVNQLTSNSDDLKVYEFSILNSMAGFDSDQVETEISRSQYIHYKDYILRVDSTLDYDEAQKSGKIYIVPPKMEIVRMSKKGLKFGMHYWFSAYKLKTSPSKGYYSLMNGFGTEDLVNIVNEVITSPIESKSIGTQQTETYVFKNDEMDVMDTLIRVYDQSFNDMGHSLSRYVDNAKPNKLVRNKLILHRKSVDTSNKKPITLLMDIQVRKISINETAKKKYLEIIQRFEEDILNPSYQEEFIKIGGRD